MGELSGFTEGTRAFRRGEHESAVALLSNLVERRDLPGRLARHYAAMSHRALGLDALAEESFTRAAGHFRRAAALVGNRADLAEYLLIAYAGSGQYDRCSAAADALVRARPDDVSARVRRAQAQWRNGDRPGAIMTLTEALRRFGDHCQLHHTLGLLHAAEERYDQAREHLAAAVECDCTSAGACRDLGLVESARGDFYHATRALQRAWVLEPEDLVVAYQLSLAAEAARQAGYRVTITLPEGRPVPSTTSQIRQLADYATKEPDFIKAFLSLPESAVDRELFGVLLSVLRTALSVHDDYADLHYYTAVASERLGDGESAGTHLRQAINLNPKYVQALKEMGELCARQEDRPRAVTYLRRAIDAGGNWPDLHVRLGDLLAEGGSMALAKEHYRQALRLNEDYAAASERLATRVA